MTLATVLKHAAAALITAIIIGGFSATAEAAGLDAHCVARDAIPDGVLAVAIRPAPPFIQEHPIRGLEGISIDLWESIARRRNLDFKYVCLNLKQTLASLEAGNIDIAISPLTISQEREEKFDFSHQYFTSGLVFAGLPDTVTFDFKRVLETLFKAINTSSFMIGAAVFIAFTVIIYVVVLKYRKHYKSPLSDPENSRAVSLHLLLMSALNMVGLRRDMFSLGTVPLQILFLAVMLLGATLSASLGGMITASIMHSVEQGKNVDITRLDEFRISTLKGSTAEAFLKQKRSGAAGEWLTRETWADALTDVTNKDADLVIGDWVQLIYLANSNAFAGKIQVDPQTIQFEPYGWGLPSASTLRDPINQELIGILRSEAWPGTIRSYIGSDLLANN